MAKTLLVGSDTEIGRHLARRETSPPRTIAFSLTEIVSRLPQSDALCELIAAERIERIVYCGEASFSCWSGHSSACGDLLPLRMCVSAARRAEIPMTFISSDAIFTGPWMFHAEDDRHECDSPRAVSIRAQEDWVLSSHPGAIIVRAHLLGWSPGGWLQAVRDASFDGPPLSLECVPHATPLYCGLFGELLDTLHASGLTGTIHLGGAERVSPYRFGSALANRLGAAPPRSLSSVSLTERPTGFGRGETSLQSALVRRLAGIRPPTLEESLEAIAHDVEAGLDEELLSEFGARRSCVA